MACAERWLAAAHKTLKLSDTLGVKVAKSCTSLLTDANMQGMLHYAALYDRARAARDIVESHPYLIDVVDVQGNTPLLLALLNNNIVVAAVLQNLGANIHAVNKRGVKAYDVAKSVGLPVHHKMVARVSPLKLHISLTEIAAVCSDQAAVCVYSATYISWSLVAKCVLTIVLGTGIFLAVHYRLAVVQAARALFMAPAVVIAEAADDREAAGNESADDFVNVGAADDSSSDSDSTEYADAQMNDNEVDNVADDTASVESINTAGSGNVIQSTMLETPQQQPTYLQGLAFSMGVAASH
jgi:hypothetical protein